MNTTRNGSTFETRYQVTTDRGLALASYFGTLDSASAYAAKCSGWGSLQIRNQWTGEVVSRA